MTKIVVIGGGSYTWGPTFLRDFFATPELRGATIVLQDIIQARVDLVYALAKKMIDDFKLDYQLEKTLSLEDALQDADFVILTITTGRLESMRPDLEIPAHYGIKQAVGDTTGPGGLSRALRNIPVVVDIARKVDEICPNALFLNYTNPMSVLTRAICMTRSIPNRTIGLCHEYIGVRRHLAKIFEVAPEQIQAKVAGINHLIWIMDLYINNQSVWNEIPAVVEKIINGEILVDSGDASVFADHFKVKSTLFKLYGALPSAGDRHLAEFFPHFINASTQWGADYDFCLTSVTDRYRMETEAKEMIQSALQGQIALEPFMQEVSTEAANKIILAILREEKYVGIMNLPNAGQIGNLPNNAIVETFGMIDANGASGMMVGDVPLGVQNVLEHHIRQQEMTVQAAMTGSWKLALQVLLNDPLSNRLTVDQAKQLLNELLEANKVYLPKFFEK